MEWVEPSGGVVCFPRIKPEAPVDVDEFYRVLGDVHGTYVGPGPLVRAGPAPHAHRLRVALGRRSWRAASPPSPGPSAPRSPSDVMSARVDVRSAHTSDQFMGAGERLHLQAWLPAGPDHRASPAEPAAVIALVHGYGDHGGRHTWFGEDMAARGYAVYAYDLRGHGQSSGTRGQVERFDDYLDDTAVFLDEVRRRQPGKPVVLLGHSLGGLICARFARGAPLRRAGARPLVAVLRPDRCSREPLKLLGAKVLSVVWPGRDIGNTVQGRGPLARRGRGGGLRHRPAGAPRRHGALGGRDPDRPGRRHGRRRRASRCRCCCCTARTTRSPTRRSRRRSSRAPGRRTRSSCSYEGFYHELLQRGGPRAGLRATSRPGSPSGCRPRGRAAAGLGLTRRRSAERDGRPTWSARRPACRRCSCRRPAPGPGRRRGWRPPPRRRRRRSGRSRGRAPSPPGRRSRRCGRRPAARSGGSARRTSSASARAPPSRRTRPAPRRRSAGRARRGRWAAAGRPRTGARARGRARRSGRGPARAPRRRWRPRSARWGRGRRPTARCGRRSPPAAP